MALSVDLHLPCRRGEGDKKIAIDPGALFFYFFRFTTLIPKSEWQAITHVFVTHGDPDHYWHADRVAKASGAPFICNETMVRNVGGQRVMLGPRSKGLRFNAQIGNIKTLSVDETIEIDGMTVTGIKATHGNLFLKTGPFSKTVKTGPTERIGWGAIGFAIELGGKRIVNLGDTLLHAQEWQTIRKPDVLMIPIGGGSLSTPWMKTKRCKPSTSSSRTSSFLVTITVRDCSPEN